MSKKKSWILRITYDGLLAALCAVLGSVAAIDIGIAKLTFENVPVVIGVFCSARWTACSSASSAFS